jgi:MFS family permease
VTFPPFLRALNSRNYRLFFSGQAVSLVGNWMSTTAIAWLAYELSGSAFVLGLLLFASQAPVLLLAPVAGVWSDRTNRRRLLLAANVGCAAQASALAVVTVTGHATVPWLLVLALMRGVLNAVEFPTRQSFLVEMVGTRDDLPNAIALNSSLFNVARLIGPTVAGLVIVAQGPAACFVADAISYTAILASLLAMRETKRRAARGLAHPLDELRAGLHYVAGQPALRASLFMVASTAFAGFTASMLAPAFARDVFHGDARVLGHFYSAMGVGALVSAGFLSTRASAAGLGLWITRGAALVVVGMAGFALSRWLWLSFACMVVNGVGAVLIMAGNNTLLQANVEDDKRGRVMGLFSMCQGMFPLGSLAAGAIANATGPRVAVGLGAAVMVLAAWSFRRSAAAQVGAAATISPAPDASPT